MQTRASPNPMAGAPPAPAMSLESSKPSSQTYGAGRKLCKTLKKAKISLDTPSYKLYYVKYQMRLN